MKSRAIAKRKFSSALFDKRVSFLYVDYVDLAELYAMADAMCWPSRGEGWGMPPREFAMTGKPVIATRWSGLEDGIDHWALPIGHTMEPSRLLVDKQTGQMDDDCLWALPDLDDLVDQMR